MHPDFCMISDRPCVLKVDEQNRPHCSDGPFCKWRDGSALYAVHGVRVPWWVIEHPQKLTIQRIESESNAEIKRVMIERYDYAHYVGAYIVDSGAKIIHKDEYGNLYKKQMPDGRDMLFLQVMNSTPEESGAYSKTDALNKFEASTAVWHDGMMIRLDQCPETYRFKDYFIPVHPQLKPLPPMDKVIDGNRVPLTSQERRDWIDRQQPQELTAHNANASTWGLRGEEYAPEIES